MIHLIEFNKIESTSIAFTATDIDGDELDTISSRRDKYLGMTLMKMDYIITSTQDFNGTEVFRGTINDGSRAIQKVFL